MMIDIDNFKKNNDTYGHQKGDELLVVIADSIKVDVRRSDIVGRYGGEEIVVFLSNIDKAVLKIVGEKIKSSVEERTKKLIPVTISIALSHNKIVSDPDKELNDLIRIADKNLYRAKEQGRNRVVV